jgi:uncharacterized Zn finger protein (UPF0148 family)
LTLLLTVVLLGAPKEIHVMGWHKVEREESCRNCGGKLVEVSLKSPFIDDGDSFCPTCEPDGEERISCRLTRTNRSAARQEEDRDEFYRRHYVEREDV